MLTAEIREAAQGTAEDIAQISALLTSEKMEADDLLTAIELLALAKRHLHILVEEVQATT